MKLMHGDCLKLMNGIDAGSVDMVLCDLPYGITDCPWDIQIPIPELWEHYKRIIKEHGAIVLFSQLPFAVDLIQGNRKMYRYEWVWDKKAPAGFLNANKMPLRVHENILVFYKKLPTYNPQKTAGRPYGNKGRKTAPETYGKMRLFEKPNISGARFPTDILTISNSYRREHFHPTQKPVALLEYLIRTYTNPGDVVLDNCMGSGSTGVACVNTGREFIGIEKDDHYYEVACERIRTAEEKKELAYTE